MMTGTAKRSAGLHHFFERRPDLRLGGDVEALAASSRIRIGGRATRQASKPQQGSAIDRQPGQWGVVEAQAHPKAI